MLERLRQRFKREPATGPPSLTPELLSAAAESMAEAFAVFDADGRLVYLNEAGRRAAAAAPIAPGSGPDDWLKDYEYWQADGSAPLTREQLPVARALAGQPVENADVLVRPKRGAPFHLRVNGRALHDAEGRVVGAVLTFRDITKDRERRQALRRLAGIVESSLDAIITCALDGTILSWNGGAEKLYGYNAPEAIGRSVSLILPPDKEEEYRRMTKPAQRGETVHFETVKLARDGRRIEVYVTLSPVRDGNGRIIGISNICHDISARRRTERALQETAALIDLAHDAVIVRDLQGRILLWNEGARRTYGWTSEQALGHVVHELLRTEFPRPREELEHIVAEKGEWQGELRHRRADGAAIVSRSRWVAKRDEKHRLIGFLEINRDETQRERAEAELHAVLDQSPSIVYVKDLEGRYLFVNRQFERVFRLPAASVVGRRDSDVFPREVAQRAREADRRALASDRPFESEHSVPWGEGTKSFVEVKFALRGPDGAPYAVCGIDLEISDRKRAEAELRERDERLHAALAAAEAGTWRLDLRTNRLTWDENSMRLFGADRQLTLEEALAVIDERDRERIRAALGKCTVEGCVYDEEFSVRLPDGSTRWLKSKARTYFDRAGRPLYMTGAQYDVTAARRQRESLVQSEDRQRMLYENVKGFAFIFIDPQGRVESWNPSAERLLGYTAQDAIGRPYDFFYTPQDVSAGVPEQHTRAALAQGRTESEGFRVRKDGTQLWVNVVMTALRDADGRLRGFAKIMRDMTEARRTLDALRRSEERFRTLAESSPVGVFQLDLEGNLVYVNERGGKIIGLGVEGSLGAGYKETIHPQDRAQALEIAAKARRAGEAYTKEHRFLHRDGTVRWVYVQAVPQKDERGRVNGYIGTLTDITLRREAEESLRRALAELERSNTELEQFAYVASHDLQEPLRKISSFAELLQRRYAGRLDADADRFIRYIVEGAGRLRQLIVDLLNYSRLGRGGLALSDVDVGQLVDRVLDVLHPRIAESGAVVEHGPLPAVVGDRGQLEQLFLNLVSNALKFTREGRAPRVTISAGREGADWRFCVEDNGIGIAPEFFEKLFVPFKRLHGRLQYPGTGIGLAICRRVVERHGGRIWIESAAGGGARFCFTLPASAAGRTS